MPAIVQVKVVAARDLPIMDRSSELTDAFVEVSIIKWLASLASYPSLCLPLPPTLRPSFVPSLTGPGVHNFIS